MRVKIKWSENHRNTKIVDMIWKYVIINFMIKKNFLQDFTTLTLRTVNIKKT